MANKMILNSKITTYLFLTVFLISCAHEKASPQQSTEEKLAIDNFIKMYEEYQETFPPPRLDYSTEMASKARNQKRLVTQKLRQYLDAQENPPVRETYEFVRDSIRNATLTEDVKAYLVAFEEAFGPRKRALANLEDAKNRLVSFHPGINDMDYQSIYKYISTITPPEIKN